MRQLSVLWEPPFPVLAVPPATILGYKAVGHMDGGQACFQASKAGQETEGVRGQTGGSDKRASHQAIKRGVWENARCKSLRQQRYRRDGWSRGLAILVLPAPTHDGQVSLTPVLQ